jgi:hydrogenase nickel incorporation protein HypA/HybF
MHELATTREILEIVLRHAGRHDVRKVERIFLEIGELSDLEQEWIQRYFDRISRGTVAEAAKIEVEIRPCSFACGDCGTVFPARLPGGSSAAEELSCPHCGSAAVRMISGDEYRVTHMEAM